ncbi:MAG: hypothetical protein AAFX90_18240 [Pseudomonadota bacterium]
MGNVSFGGNWSEEILAADEINPVLSVIDAAAAECPDRDVEDDDLESAPTYVYMRIEKGPMLQEAFLKAVRIQQQDLRRKEASRVAGLIRTWAGM